MVLDFSTLTNEDLSAYFGEGDLRHNAGYSDYELQFKYMDNQHFKNRLYSLLSLGNFNKAMSVLELGGARGHRAEHALDNIQYIESWEIIDMYNSPLKKSHPNLIYSFGDVNTLILDTQEYPDNSKDVITSFRFFECIPESKLPSLISNLNRVNKTHQFHVIGVDNNDMYYLNYDLSWWAQRGFNEGTVLISSRDFQQGNLGAVVVV